MNILLVLSHSHVEHISAVSLGSVHPSAQMQGTYTVFVVTMAISRHFHLKFPELQNWLVVGTKAEITVRETNYS